MDTGRASDELLELAAARLLEAAGAGVPCGPVRDLIGSADVHAAYAVQQRVTAARIAGGARVVGHKVGLTAMVVQAQLGVDEPDFGVLLDDMQFTSGHTIPTDAVMQPRAEAEVAFVLGADLAEGSLGAAQARTAVSEVVAAIEVCGSRVAEWDISLADTVADNASSGAFVLGVERRRLTDVEPREVTMSMRCNGRLVATGTGAACLGDPINALVWLARRARALGHPLRRGQIILSGALGPMVPIAPGDTVEATLSGLGSVFFQYGGEPQ